MKTIKFILGFLALFIGILAVYFVLTGENALVVNTKGMIARKELYVIVRNILLMLLIAIPFYLLIGALAWKYGAKKSRGLHNPEHSTGIFADLTVWIIPSVMMSIMAYLTWYDTHHLDPYKPIEAKDDPLQIQVVALDWKWLFIYPEQGIASLNFFQFPKDVPIHFLLTADGSPMNGFWLPQLSGQIYCMTGMTTQLHVVADEFGEFPGRASEINGEGYADMTFVAKATSLSEFNDWVSHVKNSPSRLTVHNYNDLMKPSINNPVAFYSYVEEDLFRNIVMKYMEH